MIDRLDFEARLKERLLARAALATRPFDAVAIARQAVAANKRRRSGGRGFTLLAAAALVAVLAGTALVGGLLDRKPDDSVVAPTPGFSAQPSTSAGPSATAAPGLIVYTRWKQLASGEEDCTSQFPCPRASIFVSNDDGSHERELFPGPYSFVVAASADGSYLIVSLREEDGDHLYLTDINGTEPRRLDTSCELPCVNDGGFAFSQDGTRLAFSRTLSEATTPPFDESGSVIAIMNMATGTVVELDSTRASNPDLGDPCHNNCGEGDDEGPSWSPDGEHLLFSRVGIGIPNQPRQFLDRTVYIVDADGSNFRQLAPLEVHAGDARWAPDGSLITFTSVLETVTTNPPDNLQQLNDIYVIRPDGTGLQRLTTDTVEPVGTTEPGEFGARFPSWTSDGQIVFTRSPAAGETVWQLWVMDRDGTNVRRLDPSDAAVLTALGCTSCRYPGVDPINAYPSLAFWVAAR